MKKSRIHFMGIGGQGISAVAQMVLQASGESVTVTGCDMQASSTTRALQRIGVPVEIGHSANHLEGIDRLVVVPAALVLNPDHPELATARMRGIPLITWQEMLGELMQKKCVISVGGVHGKGTTTAMLALMLVDAALDPTCEVGAVVPRFGVNYRLGQSQYFVNEADEFYNNFWNYHPRLAVVTSIEFEHPEFFANYEAFLASFEHFVRGMDMDGDWPLPPTLVLNAHSAGCVELLDRLKDWPGRVVTYAVEGFMIQKDINAASKEKKLTDFAGETVISMNRGVAQSGSLPSKLDNQVTFEAYDLKLEGETSFRVRSRWSISAAIVLGIDAETIVKTLESFSGIKRRFEIRNQGLVQVNGQSLDIVLVDDYAHHPTAIAATLEAARERYPGRRLVAVYQPHMFSRTKTFFAQFLSAFDLADVAIIADIFPARERDTGQVTARELVDAIAQQPHFLREGGQVLHGGSVQETAQLLYSIIRSGDVVLVMGAGDIYTLTDMIMHDEE
ncbi:MAG: UDP-N-acetylmuramate--L-alanine ligase [Chloroflexi bacterium]|nr:MAG: UDP-N-acetylmuramate--L-alanine ligase [Chloroflexota bacterium]